jgi:Patatin-like phospholipase
MTAVDTTSGHGVTKNRQSSMLILVGLTCGLVAAALVPTDSLRLPMPRITLREATWFISRNPKSRLYSHIIPPEFGSCRLSNITLRDFILHPDGIHLAIAPAFFGFFAQFGAMQAWDEAMSSPDFDVLHSKIKSLAGCSAGAMTAVLLSSGIRPATAANFCQSVTVDKFADPPGLFAVFKGHLFHDIMHNFMQQEQPDHSLQLQDGKIPVAVTAFDLKSMSGKILTRGSMPLAARASACFPFLFQPVEWKDDDGSYYFVDGGIGDMWGLEGLAAFPSDFRKPKRVVHIAVGDYDGNRGPSRMPKGVVASEVVSISIRHTPQAGPLALENGPRAVAASRLAMLSTLDLPMYKGQEPGHYIIHVDTTEFIPPM